MRPFVGTRAGTAVTLPVEVKK